MNYTPNYDLPLVEATDYPDWLTTFNDAMTDVDTALATLLQAAQDAQTGYTLAMSKATQASTDATNALSQISGATSNAQAAITKATAAETMAKSAFGSTNVNTQVATNLLSGSSFNITEYGFYCISGIETASSAGRHVAASIRQGSTTGQIVIGNTIDAPPNEDETMFLCGPLAPGTYTIVCSRTSIPFTVKKVG